ESYGPVDDVVARIVTTMGVFGMVAERSELSPGDYLAPDALAAASEVVEESCLGEIISTLAPLAVTADYWRADPLSTEPARTLLAENDVGEVAAAAPLLLVSGTADQRVVHARVLDLFERLCRNGQVTELVVLEGATHDTEVPQ